MKKLVLGVLLTVVGLIGIVFVYPLHPPRDVGDVLTILGGGQQYYLKQPVYLSLIALSGVLLIVGVITTAAAIIRPARSTESASPNG